MTIHQYLRRVKSTNMQPFLKWAGGKRQLLPALKKYIPDSFSNYVEPFVGGGAMFFHLEPERSFLSDSNDELINTYKMVRDHVEEIIEGLSHHHAESGHYYSMRSLDVSEMNSIDRAVRFIYLNRTCYNGLYRVNKNGAFNVPFGGRKISIPLINPDTLRSASRALQGVNIEYRDYQSAINEFAIPGSFVFLDPPYHPVSEFSDFKRYTKEQFSPDDQVCLYNTFCKIIDLGCDVVMTNSNSEFILDLYRDFAFEIVETKRMINSKAERRKGHDLIISSKKHGKNV